MLHMKPSGFLLMFIFVYVRCETAWHGFCLYAVNISQAYTYHSSFQRAQGKYHLIKNVNMPHAWIKGHYFIEDTVGFACSYPLQVLDGSLWRTLSEKNVEKVVVLPMENILVNNNWHMPILACDTHKYLPWGNNCLRESLHFHQLLRHGALFLKTLYFPRQIVQCQSGFIWLKCIDENQTVIRNLSHLVQVQNYN